MGGVLKLTQFVALSVGVGVSIDNEVMESEMRKIISDHQHEFDLLAFCQNMLDEISKQGQLGFQLQAGSTSSQTNWNSIAQAINSKKDILDKLALSYGSMIAKGDAHKFKFENIMWNIILPPVFFGLFEGYTAYRLNKQKNQSSAEFQTYNNSSSQQKAQLQSSSFKEYLKNPLKTLKEKFSAKDTDYISMDESNKISSRKTTVSESIDYSIEPQTKKVQAGQGKFTTAMRLLSIGLMIYMDVKIIEANAAIKKELQEMEDYFKDSGKFDQIKMDTISIMKLFSIDVFNLVAASRALAVDFQQIIYMSSIIDNEHKSSLVALSLKFKPDDLQMDFDLFKGVRSIVDTMKTIDPQDTSEYTAALEKVKSTLEPLETTWDIFNRFSTFTETMSKNLANIGYAIEDYNKYSDRLSSVIQLTEALVSERNKNLTAANIDLNNLSDPFKTIVSSFDKMTLTSDENNYKILLGPQLHGTTDFTLSIDDQKRVAQMVSMFVDVFYSDYDATNPSETDGQTIYGMNISDFNIGYTNEEIMNLISQRTSSANVIPVDSTDATEKAEFEDEFITKAMSMDAENFTDKTTLLANVQFRYQKFFVEKDKFVLTELDDSTNIREVKYDALGYSEGLMVQLTQYSPVKLYGIEKNMETDVFEIISYSL